MRRISANYVFPVDGPPIRNGIVETDDDGTIRKVYNFDGKMLELAHTEFLNGVLVPGLINMHTHLEYSWVPRVLPEGKGMPHFIEHMMASHRPEDYMDSIERADNFMYKNGTVAVADIANTSKTKEIKKQSGIRYYTFAEITGLKSQIANKRLEHTKKVAADFNASGLPAFITPHAPYSISPKLWELLQKEIKPSQMLSIHNQEAAAENEMFHNGAGELMDLFKKLNLIDDQFQHTGKSSLQSLPSFINENPLLLIHNTFTQEKDINHLLQNRKAPTGWVLCPSSNEQITGQLPDIKTLKKADFPIMLGTDSTASGASLSLLDEIKILQQKLNLPFNRILAWATLNAAKFMGWDDLGSFTPGKKPGINVITGFDFNTHALKSTAKIRRIL